MAKTCKKIQSELRKVHHTKDKAVETWKRKANKLIDKLEKRDC